ncbi:MAG: ATP-binding cassette domain-containing protein [Pseudomonadota bacterium]
MILRVDDLTVAHAGAAPLVAHWSAVIGPGVTLLHGDTGSGKSTVLRALAGQHPVTGRLTLAGAALDADAAAYRRRVFFCEATTDAFDQITARAATAALSDGDTAFDAARWAELADGFSLAPHLDKPLYMLSTGSKRKVWLAAALASGRPLVLLDEPTGGLDAPSVRCLWAALARIAAGADRAVIVASAERLAQVPLAATIELPLTS